jgi:Domain of unknown function (DUF4115)
VGGFPRTRPSELVDRTVQPLRVGPLAARPTCPRCSSPHIVPARRAALSDEISALRGGAESELITDEFDHWFCSACGQGWPHVHRTTAVPGASVAPIEPTGAATFQEALLEPANLPIAREVRTAPQFVDDPAPPTRRRPTRWKGVAIAVVLVAAVGGAAALIRSSDRDEAGVRLGTPTADVAADHQRSASGRIRAVMRLTEPTWVRAVADGKVVERSELKPGHAIVFRGRKVLRLTLGNGGAVELRVDGERVKTGPAGQPISLTFVRRNGRVVTRTA